MQIIKNSERVTPKTKEVRKSGPLIAHSLYHFWSADLRGKIWSHAYKPYIFLKVQEAYTCVFFTANPNSAAPGAKKLPKHHRWLFEIYIIISRISKGGLKQKYSYGIWTIKETYFSSYGTHWPSQTTFRDRRSNPRAPLTNNTVMYSSVLTTRIAAGSAVSAPPGVGLVGRLCAGWVWWMDWTRIANWW